MFGSDIIRVKIKGFLKNITENEILNFDEKGIKNKNKIVFLSDDVKYNIKYNSDEIILIRDGKEFNNTFVFNKNKGSSSYTLKENNYTIVLDIDVKNMIISDSIIYIEYVVCDTNCYYVYKIEMSECL